MNYFVLFYLRKDRIKNKRKEEKPMPTILGKQSQKAYKLEMQ